MNDSTETKLQREYYGRTAGEYDAAHVETGEHELAMTFLSGIVSSHGIQSILDVGAGTGRVCREFARTHPGLRVVGIEPVKELREIGIAKGIAPDALIEGDGRHIQFGDGAFDLACAFGVLHHVRDPQTVVGEMLRVAKRAIFISDSNNFGQGHTLARAAKQAINAARLWPLANWIKTRGKGYSISEGDGLAYSYSLFNNWKQIRAACSKIHVLTTDDTGVNPYRSCGYVAILAIKG